MSDAHILQSKSLNIYNKQRPSTASKLNINDSISYKYGQHILPSLQSSSLLRINSYHERDLVDSYINRTGIKKNELLKQINSRPYSSRPNTVNSKLPQTNFTSVEDEMKELTILQRKEADAEKRMIKTTKSLVDQLETLKAKTEFETIRQAENMSISRRAQTANINKTTIPSRPQTAAGDILAWSLDSKLKDKSPWICSQPLPSTTSKSVRPYSAVTSLSEYDAYSNKLPTLPETRGQERVHVDRARTALAKHGLHVNLNTLENALMTPTTKFTDEEKKMMFAPPSSMLFKNPFLEESKSTKSSTKDTSIAKANKKLKKKKSKKGGDDDEGDDDN